MRRHRQELRARRVAMRGAEREVLRSLRVDPFNREMFRDALDRLQAHTADTQSTLHMAFADLAAELSVEERRAMAKAMRRGRAGKGKRKGKGKALQP